ncbi:ATP-binding cassette domain-containing protein [Mycoplasmopsis meleagridis]|uniref:ATP-binding cassette domain-containing protein n=1 Tax=Mycoplasmopsis meleagridis TaxID=29561 RepID=UPI00073D79AA|nr:ATP-binding cassette domain-containing protein [Mycoplasmopsis meleagridis]KUH47381.1 peptide ABC transporter ATP-binding protein [Mycoplasmopsis meleagridis]
MSNKKVILSLDNLKKYFVSHGSINKAVDGVTFDVHEGEIVGLIGESGSGKTTVGRSIFRLFDDVNGFIRLEDKIISGKKISNKLKKYLHKNVQMIFQDPHASLNSQQNIFSILREPLLVNDIIKNKIDDIFLDWLEVKKTFKYEFQIHAMQLELDNLRIINNLAEEHFTSWKNKFENFEFNPDLDFDDNFNSFFSYLDQKQQIESAIINNLYSNTSKLIDFYYEKQKQYRANDITAADLALQKVYKDIENNKLLIKYSQEGIDAQKELVKVKNEYSSFLRDKKEFLDNAKNVIDNFIIETKHEKQLVNITRLSASDLNYFAHNYKNELLLEKRAQFLNEIKYIAHYLTYEQIRDLISNLDNYLKSFFNIYLNEIEYQPNLKKVIKRVIDEKFDFKISKYQELSKQKSIEFHKSEANYLEKINNLENIIEQSKVQKTDKFNSKNLSINYQGFWRYNQQEESYIKVRKFIGPLDPNDPETRKYDPKYVDLINKRKIYLLKEHNQNMQAVSIDKAKEAHSKETEQYLEVFKIRIKELHKEINEARAKYEELVSYQTYCNNRFEEIKDEYFKFVNEILLQREDADKKNIAIVTSSYKSDISVREETLKSFNIEKKYLSKDIANIYILLGINHNWVDKNIEDDEIKNDENDIDSSKWENDNSFYNLNISIPLAKKKISNLLYKTTIYKALEDVGLLKQFAYRYPHEFSGGQLQRIVIARALITEPKVIVADEPIASLDISIQAQVVNLLKDLCLKKNIGLIFIAHDLSMIEYIADNVQIMHLGKIVEYGKTESIYAKPYHPYTINLFKAIPKISNAHEKFQNVSFELDYIKEQQFPNIPTFHKINDEEHYVYGTSEQVKKWLNGEK